MNDPVFIVIDIIIIALVWRVDRLLTKIERNTRRPHFTSECCDERQKP